MTKSTRWVSSFSKAPFQLNQHLPVIRLVTPLTEERGIELWVLRLDQTDSVVSGNKWFKLKYNLLQARESGRSAVLSFGGAYSNHIHALAKAGFLMGIQTIGVIRGEPEYANNPTLQDAIEWGMKLQFVDRKTYRRRHDTDYQELLSKTFDDPVIIPEGGSNSLAIKGCAEILSDELLRRIQPDQIVLPCGTGGTLAGVCVANPELNILGIPVLKEADFLYQDIRNLIQDAGMEDSDNWQLDLEGHYGGYAKADSSLIAFIQQMNSLYHLPLEQVYTGKMLMRLMERIDAGLYPEGSSILALHTGGLQGTRSLEY